MSDYSNIDSDAENIDKNKFYTAEDHLMHLLKIGYSPDSLIIKQFAEQNNLQVKLEKIKQENN